jgi:hypothetical protein
MYFDTGCRPHNSPNLHKGQVWRNGTKQIPFDVDAPESATLLFLCDNPELPEATDPAVLVREVFNTAMLSRYAYLRT